jgi:hypothetical protein
MKPNSTKTTIHSEVGGMFLHLHLFEICEVVIDFHVFSKETSCISFYNTCLIIIYNKIIIKKLLE